MSLLWKICIQASKDVSTKHCNAKYLKVLSEQTLKIDNFY